MKASMSSAGVITLEPENGVEAYALWKWSQDNYGVFHDGEDSKPYWKGAGLVVQHRAFLKANIVEAHQ